MSSYSSDEEESKEDHSSSSFPSSLSSSSSSPHTAPVAFDPAMRVSYLGKRIRLQIETQTQHGPLVSCAIDDKVTLRGILLTRPSAIKLHPISSNPVIAALPQRSMTELPTEEEVKLHRALAYQEKARMDVEKLRGQYLPMVYYPPPPGASSTDPSLNHSTPSSFEPATSTPAPSTAPKKPKKQRDK